MGFTKVIAITQSPTLVFFKKTLVSAAFFLVFSISISLEGGIQRFIIHFETLELILWTDVFEQ